MTVATSTPQSTPQGGRSTQRIFERERRHSRRVRILKFALPTAAVLLTVGLIGNAVVSSLSGGAIDIRSLTLEGGRLVMDNPNLEGMTAQNRPYEMKARRAIQSVSEPDVVNLEEITARLPIGTSEWADVNAATGTLYRDRNQLEIDSPVELKTSDGLTAHLKSALIDTNAGSVSSDETVKIDYEGSTVTADSMNVSQGGAVLVFERNVRVHMQPTQFRTASASGGVGNADD